MVGAAAKPVRTAEPAGSGLAVVSQTIADGYQDQLAFEQYGTVAGIPYARSIMCRKVASRWGSGRASSADRLNQHAVLNVTVTWQ
jgi:hypothetical protein